MENVRLSRTAQAEGLHRPLFPAQGLDHSIVLPSPLYTVMGGGGSNHEDAKRNLKQETSLSYTELLG